MDAKKGTEFVIRELFLPHLRDSYDDLTAAAAGADLFLTRAASPPKDQNPLRRVAVRRTLSRVAF